MDTTKTTDTETKDLTDEAAEAPEAGKPAAAQAPKETAATDRTDRGADGLDDDGPEADAPVPARSTPVAAGAAAVVGAALGLASLTGTWVGRLAAERQQLIGQIKTSSGAAQAQAQEQITALYSTPWHTTALFNGVFALVALIVSGAVLLRPAGAGTAQAPWIRAVSVAGVVLGILGLLVSGGIYFDLLGGVPTAP
ncbi:hypothetical protein ABT112_23460 [Streptomyces sp. NPDC002055]|uniref:hypothetical protein n=1 Tax=Streptomyces sp. NPDC002055 TaxID=3154534 RepID=UPI003321B159